MAREYKTTKAFTQIIYRNEKGGKMSAIFTGHLSDSEIERQMLFVKHIPKRLILATEYKFN